MKKDKLLLISVVLNILSIILFTIMIVSKPKPKEVLIIDEDSKRHIDFLENLVLIYCTTSPD